MPLWLACLQPWVIDGDSIRCSNLGEIRVLGIDTPDRTSSRPCREGFGDHVCDDAGAKRAKAALIALHQKMKGERWTAAGYGRDRYGRLLARVRAGSIEIGCFQLANGSARYIPNYDKDGVVRAACGRR
jgi:micrococcal nuclease